MAFEFASCSLEGRTPRAPVRRLGGWKLAYADFLTALCALFLIMWLVNGATPGARKDVAKSFGAPAPVEQAASNEARLATLTEDRLLQSPLFASQTANVSLERSDGSIRINLIDLDRSPLFETGRSGLNTRGERLVGLAAEAVIQVGLPVSIEGHTDSQPIRQKNYSNWELSADRANAARRAMAEHGVPAHLISSVTGLADTRPLSNENPSLPQNRRLSIVVHLDAR
ncbi:OmpA family protein [Henriciella sp.]|uniref:OmpA/MotB family protein n=1 Tax=Henriciella sp. TaxID=1968823 RepID=UPI0026303D78|nr:OmpA family protein [Henriciella sp.]